MNPKIKFIKVYEKYNGKIEECYISFETYREYYFIHNLIKRIKTYYEYFVKYSFDDKFHISSKFSDAEIITTIHNLTNNSFEDTQYVSGILVSINLYIIF